MKGLLLACIAILLMVLPAAGCAGLETPQTPISARELSTTSPAPANAALAAPAPSHWTQTYRNEGENDSPASVFQVDEGFLLVGQEGHYSDAEKRDVYRTFLLMTDDTGEQIWKKTLDEYQSLKQISAAFPTVDQGLLIFETRMSASGSGSGYRYELVIIKIDQKGEKLWSKTVETAINSQHRIIQASAAGFIISGRTLSGTNMEVLEVDDGGTVIRRRTLPLPVAGAEYQNIIMQTTTGGDFLFAAKKITGERQSVIAASSIDPEGRLLWVRTYDAPGFQLSPSHILENSNGEVTIIGSAGSTTEMIRPWAKLYILHLDSEGNLLWDLTWGENNHRYSVSSVTETEDGGYLIAGLKSPLSPLPGVAYVVKIDRQGKEAWSRTFGELAGSYVRSQADSVISVSDGFIIAGNFGNFPANPADRDIFLMKADLQGNLDLSPLQALMPVPVTPSQDPENTIIRTIQVNQPVTSGGITIVLEKVDIRAKGFSFNAVYAPPGYSPTAPFPSSIPGARAEYSLDGGQARELPSPPPFSLTDKGIGYSWISLDQIPPEAEELTVRITSMGKEPGPWEFRVPLD